MSIISGALGLVGSGAKKAGTALFSASTPFAKNNPVTSSIIRSASFSAIGGGVGAVTGYASSDANNPTNLLMDTLRGAALGAGAVFGARAAYSGARKGVPKLFNTAGLKAAHHEKRMFSMSRKAVAKGKADYIQVGPRLPSGAFSPAEEQAMSYTHQLATSPLARFGKGTYANAAAVGKFIKKHPYAVGGVIGGATLAANLPGESSPTMTGAKVNTRYDQQAIAAMELQTGVGAAGSNLGAGGAFGAAPQMMGRFHRAHQASTAGLVQGLHRGRHG